MMSFFVSSSSSSCIATEDNFLLFFQTIVNTEQVLWVKIQKNLFIEITEFFISKQFYDSQNVHFLINIHNHR